MAGAGISFEEQKNLFRPFAQSQGGRDLRNYQIDAMATGAVRQLKAGPPLDLLYSHSTITATLYDS